jgi:hypothetical protein
VKRDHVPPVEGAVSFHATRWTIVMKAVRSQAHEEQTAIPEIDGKIHALCDAPAGSEGRLSP